MFRLEELTFRYRRAKTPALAGLTYSGESGVVGLIGVNGAGKSTLLNLMAGTLAASSGTCAISDLAGREWSAQSRQAKGLVALMPQDVVLPASLRLLDFLGYMAWVRGVPRQLRSMACRESLDAVGLVAQSQQRIGDLSGGMRRRLLLAQALLGSPRLLLLDEPTASLDPEQRAGVRELVASLRGEVATIVISSHEIDDLASVCDRFLMLEKGTVIFDGSTDELERRGSQLVSPGSTLSGFEAAFLQLRKSQV